jgi:hypothetical protein
MTSAHELVMLVAELPDPGSPSFATYGAAFGLFVGGLVGRARRLTKDESTRVAADGAFFGFGIGFACWLVALAIDRL